VILNHIFSHDKVFEKVPNRGCHFLDKSHNFRRNFFMGWLLVLCFPKMHVIVAVVSTSQRMGSSEFPNRHSRLWKASLNIACSTSYSWRRTLDFPIWCSQVEQKGPRLILLRIC
jgi:hypothetical protein